MMVEQGIFEQPDILAILVCGFVVMLVLGLLLKEILANLGARLLLTMQKPFRKGDTIRAAGVMGTVQSIGLFRTLLGTPENGTISIPNTNVLRGSISKLEKQATHRVDMLFGIGHMEDLESAKDIIVETLTMDERIHKAPAWRVSVSDHTSSSVYIKVRLWVNVENYWAVLLETTERIKRQLNAEEIRMTYP